MYSRICLLGIVMGHLLLGGNNVFSQSKKGFDMDKLYEVAIKKYLLPSEDNSESILYLIKPSFKPEYSIRVIVFKDSIKLVGDFFKENYFGQLVGHIQKYYNVEFEPEVNHYSVLVSKRFKRKMKSVFSQTINSKVSCTSSSGDMPLDGTTYLFRLDKSEIRNGENSSLEVWEPKADCSSYKTATICSTIAISLKNNSFNESKIIKTIKESGF